MTSLPFVLAYWLELEAGVPGKEKKDGVRLGDIVVSQPTGTSGGVVQYDMGRRLVEGKFQRTGHHNKPSLFLSAHIEKLKAQHRNGSRTRSYVAAMLARHQNLQEEYQHPGPQQD